MTLLIPELKLPLGGISACASGISLSEHPDLNDIIPVEQTEEIAVVGNGDRYLRLLSERFDENRCHFHLDVLSREFVVVTKPDSTVDRISAKFSALIGKTFSVRFHSRFKLKQSEIPPIGLIPSLGSVGLNLGGTNAVLSGATIRVSDSVYQEIKWQRVAPAPDRPAEFYVELGGDLGTVSVSQDILQIVLDRALAGLKRFVVPPFPQRAPRPK